MNFNNVAELIGLNMKLVGSDTRKYRTFIALFILLRLYKVEGLAEWGNKSSVLL